MYLELACELSLSRSFSPFATAIHLSCDLWYLFLSFHLRTILFICLFLISLRPLICHFHLLNLASRFWVSCVLLLNWQRYVFWASMSSWDWINLCGNFISWFWRSCWIFGINIVLGIFFDFIISILEAFHYYVAIFRVILWSLSILAQHLEHLSNIFNLDGLLIAFGLGYCVIIVLYLCLPYWPILSLFLSFWDHYWFGYLVFVGIDLSENWYVF